MRRSGEESSCEREDDWKWPRGRAKCDVKYTHEACWAGVGMGMGRRGWATVHVSSKAKRKRGGENTEGLRGCGGGGWNEALLAPVGEARLRKRCNAAKLAFSKHDLHSAFVGAGFAREIGIWANLSHAFLYVPLFQVGSLSTWYASACDSGMYSAVRYWCTSAKVFFAYPLCWSSEEARMRSSIMARSTLAMGLESVILRLDMDMRLCDIDVLEDRWEAEDDDRGVEMSELEVLYE